MHISDENNWIYSDGERHRPTEIAREIEKQYKLAQTIFERGKFPINNLNQNMYRNGISNCGKYNGENNHDSSSQSGNERKLSNLRNDHPQSLASIRVYQSQSHEKRPGRNLPVGPAEYLVHVSSFSLQNTHIETKVITISLTLKLW